MPTTPTPVDRPAEGLRDRIRRAICEASGFTWLPNELMEPDEYGEHADAVLSVLPAPALAVAQQLLGTTTGEGPADDEREPVQLRWGLDDVMHGDDDTTTLLLSGPDREPYWVELDPERTAALRDALAGPAVPPAPADRAALRNVRSHTLASIACHLDARSVAILRPESETYAEWQAVAADLRRLADDAAAGVQPPTTSEARPDDIQVWPLTRVLTEVRCGSQDWTWDKEWADLDQWHAETGYLDRLEQEIKTRGITMPVLIGSDGRLWDGHHRLRIAVRLGIAYVPVEITPAAGAPAQEVARG